MEWAAAAIKTSEEIYNEAKQPSRFSRNPPPTDHNASATFSIATLHATLHQSLATRIFFLSLFFWSAVYFVFVKGGSADEFSTSVESSVVTSASSSEYSITDEERGHWALSLLHSIVTVLGSGYLLSQSTEKRKWWALANDQRPEMVALVAFSASYFLIDTAFVLSEIGYVIHHG
jgi:hypothetical protein